MKRGNVLVIGNSGVGKSMLINAVLGEERANVDWGTEGTTKQLEIFYNEKIPFQLIDTVGFEPSFVKEHKAIHAVKKWSKESSKKGHENTQINVIWFCVDGTARKLFSKAIDDLSKATSMWKTVPVIVVITKSYSVPDRTENIEMVNNAFAKQRRSKNLSKVIPVVSSTFMLNETAYAAPEGITELIDATNELMPEGIKAGEKDIAVYKLNRKRALAHGITGVSTTAAVVVGAVPIPFSDGILLAPMEIALVNALARIYEIGNNEDAKKIFDTIVKAGTVGIAAKVVVDKFKLIPGVGIGACALNAIIAGSIVAALGEGTIHVFEQVYLGKKSILDIEWVKEEINSKYISQFANIVETVAEKITESTDEKTIAQIIADAVKNIFGGHDIQKA